MSTFKARLDLSSKFEEIFREEFNRFFHEKYRIIKFGIETTKLIEEHEILRYCHDPVSHFVRYLPDSVLVEFPKSRTHRKCNNFLIEFKTGLTGIKKETFFTALQKECPDVFFKNKEDVFNIEKEALDLYRNLEQKLGLPVILVVYVPYRKKDFLLAQFASEVQICNYYDPNARRKGKGSGTLLYNISLCSFLNLTDFLTSELKIHSDSSKIFAKNLEEKLFDSFSST